MSKFQSLCFSFHPSISSQQLQLTVSSAQISIILDSVEYYRGWSVTHFLLQRPSRVWVFVCEKACMYVCGWYTPRSTRPTEVQGQTTASPRYLWFNTSQRGEAPYGLHHQGFNHCGYCSQTGRAPVKNEKTLSALMTSVCWHRLGI